MNEQEIDRLLLCYLEATLDAEGTLLLLQTLEHDAEARRRLRDIAEQAIAIGDAARLRESRSLVHADEISVISSKKSWWQQNRLRWTAAMLVALVGIGLLLVFQQRAPEPVLQVLAVHGAVTWSDGGEWSPLVVGDKLAAGTIETESDAATAEIGLADGTRFNVHGGTRVLFSENLSKLLLKRGTFTASVAKQPPSRPLRVRTPAAEVEVVGTVFTLDARPQQTNLSVAKGRVRLKRLIDGREVDVAAKQHVAASLVATDQMIPQSMQSPPPQWRLSFDAPPERLTGTWHNATADEISFIEATPTVARLMPSGRVFVHHSAIVRADSNSVADAFALLTEGSALRIKIRVQRAVPLQLMIATRSPNGGFAGNFELVKRHPELIGDGRWHTLEIPIREFIPLHHDRSQVAAGNLANVVIITTLHHAVDLGVAGVSIVAAERDPPSTDSIR